MSDMKALSLHQPYASLVAVGAKGIDTRSWPTRYRGRLLIHAAKRTVDLDGIILWQDAMEHREPVPPTTKMGNLPLGAVVASCRLVDCVPIRTTDDTPDDEWPRVTVNTPGAEPWGLLGGGVGAGVYGIGDQLPFGDFSPGRYAWLLDDVKPTTERCPHCWGEWGDYCETCDTRRCCDPVPMRGRQQLWTPTWEAP